MCSVRLFDLPMRNTIAGEKENKEERMKGKEEEQSPSFC